MQITETEYITYIMQSLPDFIYAKIVQNQPPPPPWILNDDPLIVYVVLYIVYST